VGLIRLVTQLLNQATRDFSYEIIVVDDGSPDPVEPVLSAEFPQPPVALKCIRKVNGGPASARNAGAKCAVGELLVFVDDDMAIREDFLLGHVETQRTYGPGLVNCYFDWEVDASPPSFARWYKNRIEEWNAVRRQQVKPIAEDVFLIPNVNATTANLSVPTDAFQKANGFDTGYPFGCEDQDFALRLEFAGYSAFMTTKTKAVHIETHNTLVKVCQRQARGSADTVRFLRRFAVEARFGKQPIAYVNDPICFGIDPWHLVVKKLIRGTIVKWPMRHCAFTVINILERFFPDATFLHRTYNILISAYSQQGWREGVQRYSSEPPLPCVAALLQQSDRLKPRSIIRQS